MRLFEHEVDPRTVSKVTNVETHSVLLNDLFPEFQALLLDDGQIVAIGSSIPFHWTEPAEDLPDDGWDFVVNKGFADLEAGLEPTAISALWVTVSSDRRRAGLSSIVLNGLRHIAATHNMPSLFAPVRPTLKSEFPLEQMEEYVRRTSDDGVTPFDPWLRTHWRLGGQILHVCSNSIEHILTVEEWQSAGGYFLSEAGVFIMPGALVPVQVDFDHDIVTYMEPNVWVRHNLEAFDTSVARDCC
jgi:hypothetical protein